MSALLDARPAGSRLSPEPRPPRRRVARARRILGYAALVVATAAVLLPFYWMVMSSLKTNSDVFTIPVRWLPDRVVWSNYLDIWRRSGMTTWLRNTLVLSVAVTVLQVLTGSFAAYGFAKVRFPGRNALFLAYLGTIAVPWQSYMIPQFILFSKLHLSNTLWSIVALQAFSAFGVFLMKQYYESIPDELIDAARIDGMTEYGIYRRIMLPLSVPALASLVLLTLVNTWNDYLGPLLYLRSPGLWTIQIGLKSFISQYNAEYALIMTGSVLSVLPIAIIFLAGQRYFVEGIATTGLKGMSRPRVRPETFGRIFGAVYLGLMTNALLVVFCLPLVVVLLTTDPARSWPLLALLAPGCAPAVVAAFAVLGAYTGDRDRPVARTFTRAWRAAGRRALLAGALASALLVVLGVDARAAWGRPIGALVLPPLVTAMVLVAATTLLVLTVLAERPRARLRDAVRVCLVLAVRRWYLTALSLLVLALFEAFLVSRPALALGLAASPMLYVAWANSRFTLTSALAPPVTAGSKGTT